MRLLKKITMWFCYGLIGYGAIISLILLTDFFINYYNDINMFVTIFLIALIDAGIICMGWLLWSLVMITFEPKKYNKLIKRWNKS